MVESSQSNVTVNDGDATAQPSVSATSEPDLSQVSVCPGVCDETQKEQLMKRMKNHVSLWWLCCLSSDYERLLCPFADWEWPLKMTKWPTNLERGSLWPLDIYTLGNTDFAISGHWLITQIVQSHTRLLPEVASDGCFNSVCSELQNQTINLLHKREHFSNVPGFLVGVNMLCCSFINVKSQFEL